MTCPSCGNTKAYVGFTVVECPNPECTKFHGPTYETLSRVLAAMPRDPFFGLDNSQLANTVIECGVPLTKEILDAAFARIWASSSLPPCGSKKRPHLCAPVGAGVWTYCVSCGTSCRY